MVNHTTGSLSAAIRARIRRRMRQLSLLAQPTTQSGPAVQCSKCAALLVAYKPRDKTPVSDAGTGISTSVNPDFWPSAEISRKVDVV